MNEIEMKARTNLSDCDERPPLIAVGTPRRGVR